MKQFIENWASKVDKLLKKGYKIGIYDIK